MVAIEPGSAVIKLNGSLVESSLWWLSISGPIHLVEHQMNAMGRLWLAYSVDVATSRLRH